jgi:L,D-peptidoglycan transpeptidase YkuD (ErfK/YbiS/YcfS/YnhG family)
VEAVGPRRRTLATVAALGVLASGCTGTTGGNGTSTPTATHSRQLPTTSAALPSGPASPAAPRRPPSSAPAPEPSAPTSHRPHGVALPLPFRTGDARQVITAVAPSTSSTEGSVRAWRRVADGWRPVGAPVHAWFGTDGLTRRPSESLSATPIGSFTLTRAFGRLADPGSALPYTRTTPADWWISQPGPLYNTRQRCSTGCAFTQGDPNEHLYYTTPYYRYAVVIDYNTANSPTGVVQGAGSAFFLHVTVGAPTQGCISIAQPALVRLLRWLSPAQHPRILIGT